ncbi:MAG: CYTH domain-containing protein [bacterium]
MNRGRFFRTALLNFTKFGMFSQETEIKIDLAFDFNYQKLLTFFPGEKKILKQDNYFFDSADRLLSRSGWVLRLRLEEERASLTLKGTASESRDGLAIRPEISARWDYQRARQSIAEGISSAEILPLSIVQQAKMPVAGIRLETMIHFMNYRVSIPQLLANLDLILEIDRTEFDNGDIDYELEVEIPGATHYDPVIKELENLLGHLEIPLKFHTQSKFARALAKANRQI